MSVAYQMSVVLFLLLSTVFIWLWASKSKKKEHDDFLQSLPEKSVSGLPRILNYSVAVCTNTAENMIESIVSGNKIESCRIYRVFGSEYDRFELYHRKSNEKNPASNENPEDIYLEYLWEATLKLAETGKNLVVHPDYDCTRTEVEHLSEWKDKLPKTIKGAENPAELGNSSASDLAEACRINKERISGDIREYTNAMSYTDYEDGSQKYNFLSFLQYFYSFLMSMDNIMKPYRAA